MNVRRALLVAIKAGFGFTLLAILLSRIKLDDLLTSLTSANLRWLFLALFTFGIASVFEIIKFRAACQYLVDRVAATKLVLSGLFFNNFLPSNIGGDGYKLWRLRERDIPASSSLFYLVSDRVTGMTALLLLGAASLLLSASARELVILSEGFQRLQHSGASISWLVAAIVTASAIATVLLRRSSFWQRTKEILRSIASMSHRYAVTSALPTLVYALAFHVSRGIAISLACHSLGAPVALLPVLFILSIVALAAMLPISIGGLGVREGILAYLLAEAGIPGSIAIAVALINLGVLWIKSIAGGLIFLADRRELPIQVKP